MICYIHAHIQLGVLHLFNLPLRCPEVGQYMEALNHYFHDQKTGEYWRPFGHKKSPRNTRQNDKTVVGNKHRHTGLEIRFFLPKNKRSLQYYFICHIFCLGTVYIYTIYNIYLNLQCIHFYLKGIFEVGPGSFLFIFTDAWFLSQNN